MWSRSGFFYKKIDDCQFYLIVNHSLSFNQINHSSGLYLDNFSH